MVDGHLAYRSQQAKKKKKKKKKKKNDRKMIDARLIQYLPNISSNADDDDDSLPLLIKSYVSSSDSD